MASEAASDQPQSLLGLLPSSPDVASYIAYLSTLVAATTETTPEVKSYSDAVYLNYFPLGVSFLFKPQKGYKPPTGLKLDELKSDSLILDGLDIYNIPNTTRASTKSKPVELAFSNHPASPLVLAWKNLIATDTLTLMVRRDTTGKEFVEALGEPDRKGGGGGPTSGSIGIWCEWSKHGFMVEFGGDEANGPQAWETGKDAVWKVITLFPVVQKAG
ncbi:hypothetical protein BDN72DRAFT_34022 [Pluteus cervinus]|uniref:Uncharacterized protein n=1 Tax=Pluteus cervinus TaxID=181527 RepID=A0ACD3BHJ8_9AGAR|nr:hypothetical protein BDN72DRAFT_34022 [Pluteus cervinus]